MKTNNSADIVKTCVDNLHVNVIALRNQDCITQDTYEYFLGQLATLEAVAEGIHSKLYSKPVMTKKTYTVVTEVEAQYLPHSDKYLVECPAGSVYTVDRDKFEATATEKKEYVVMAGSQVPVNELEE